MLCCGRNSVKITDTSKTSYPERDNRANSATHAVEKVAQQGFKKQQKSSDEIRRLVREQLKQELTKGTIEKKDSLLDYLLDNEIIKHNHPLLGNRQAF